MADPTSPRSAVALVIGIGSYPKANGRVSPLPCAPRDAEAVGKLLADAEVCGFPAGSVTVLLDDKATREELVHQLDEEFCQQAKGKELAVVYFAGHGTRQPGTAGKDFLIPWNGDLGRLTATCIAMQDVAEWVGKIPAANVVFLLDCCHAASAEGIRDREATATSLERVIRPDPAALLEQTQFRQPGRYWLFACGKNQTSLEVDGIQHGLFTYHLLEGLREKASADAEGRVDLDSLFKFVRDEVVRQARKLGKEQEPQRSVGGGGGDVFLAHRRRKPPAEAVVVPPEYLRLQRLWDDEGADAAIAAIEASLPTSDEAMLTSALRLVADRAEVRGTYVVFHAARQTSEKVRRYVNHAIKTLGWAKLKEGARQVVARGPAERIDVLLTGADAIAADPHLTEFLAHLIDLRLPPLQETTARKIFANKQLALRLGEVDDLFSRHAGDYRLVKALGEGSVASAYLVEYRPLDERRVIRVLQKRHREDLVLRKRFLELARWAARFRDGAVVRTLGLDEGGHYVVRDFVDGVTLQEALASGVRFRPPQALRILRRLAEALADVHAIGGPTGSPHGGVKPSNVFLTLDEGAETGAPARRVVLGDPAVLLPRQLLGGGDHQYLADARYLAPEVFEPTPPGPASDLYSLGCVGYELFCGLPPFVSPNLAKTLAMHQFAPPEAPSARGSPGGPGVDELLLRLLEKDPGRRYPDACEVADVIADLERALRRPPPSTGPRPIPPGGPGGPPGASPGAGESMASLVWSAGVSHAPGASFGLIGGTRFAKLLAQRSGVDLVQSVNLTSLPEDEPLSVIVAVAPGGVPRPQAPPIPSDPSPSKVWEAPTNPPTSPYAPGAHISPGTEIGRYQVSSLIGQGGMGSVYLARDSQLDRPVAIKVLSYVPGSRDELLARFQREAKLTARLRHPGVCPILDVGIHAGLPYYVMPFIEGRSLRDLTLPCEEREALRIVREVTLAMSAVHQAGIIHRDLKPSNIILQPDGHPIILDFGIARPEYSDEDLVATGIGQFVGTLAFASPEQLRGQPIGPTTDIYALGITLFVLLTGELPFDGPAVLRLAQILEGAQPNPHQYREELSAATVSICLKAMARKPGERFASMEEFAEALNAAMRHLDGEPMFSSAPPAPLPAPVAAHPTPRPGLLRRLLGWLFRSR